MVYFNMGLAGLYIEKIILTDRSGFFWDFGIVPETDEMVWHKCVYTRMECI